MPGLSAAMATRMTNDMTFDPVPSISDIGSQPRPFHPRF
jgi:hypothetical protein